MNLNTTLKEARVKKKITQQELADQVGVTKQAISQFENGAAKPKESVLEKISQVLEIDLTSKVNDTNAKYIASIDYPIEHGEQKAIPLGNGKYMMIVPLVQEFAHAGYLSGWKDPEYIDELPKHTLIVDQQPHSEYKSFEVIGDSMRNPDNIEESILDGSIATGRFLDRHHWTSKFHTHRWKDFVIVHKNGILIKRIKSHNVLTGNVVLESLNPDKATYPDKEINLNDVFQIFNIINVSKAR